MSALLNRYRAASARERRMLLLAAVVIVGALLLTLADWAHSEGQRLDRALPAAQARLARMQAQADELTRLRAAPPLAEAPLRVRGDAARAAANARGLKLEIEIGPDSLQISGQGSAATLLDWIATVQAEQGLRPTELEVHAEGDGQRFSGRLVAVGDDGST